MSVSVFELFKPGIGPSSSHTVGPMLAAGRFLADAGERSLIGLIAAVQVDLYGSLALTGRGHGTDRAVILGLLGEHPTTIDADAAPALVDGVLATGRLSLAGGPTVLFSADAHLRFHPDVHLPRHPNGLTFTACDTSGKVLLERTYYSVGGGFVVGPGEPLGQLVDGPPQPYPYHSAGDLLALAQNSRRTIADIVLANETATKPESEVRDGLDIIWSAMTACVDRGLSRDGLLPGPFKVRRRARRLHEDLQRRAADSNARARPLDELEWVMAYALAVNEENASGGRVVTAPTNGAAGIIPAVLTYYGRFYTEATRRRRHDFLLTAAGIGALYKENASISGAEVGCQGEVGVASSMAAAGLSAVLGGTPQQIENAAEIAMEHNLGLTCDPVGGLVQIPCIERNAVGAVKAITAAQLALSGDGRHSVSLDKVIETMRQTGADMRSAYKETSRGGLAVNITEC